MDKPVPAALTTAAQLDEMRRLVAWTLWKMATDEPPPADGHYGEYSDGVKETIQQHAKSLFGNGMWIANVVGEFAANHAGPMNTLDWEAFVENFKEA